jgi:DNA-binding transcriptional LysR family regulator
VPFLAYAPGAYLGRVVDWVLKQSGETCALDRVYETDMSESLKAMAIEGHGLAFLPASAVRSRRWVTGAWSMPRPTPGCRGPGRPTGCWTSASTARRAARSRNLAAQLFWERLMGGEKIRA